MARHKKPPPTYSRSSAEMYDALGIRGTTYEIGFDCVSRMLGNLEGKVFLDYGSGTGRSAEFLLKLGAHKVFGVDHSPEMLRVARSGHLSNVAFMRTDSGRIPLPDDSMDGAISLSVFVEIRNRKALKHVCREVARVLQPGGPLVVMSTSPGAFGSEFRSFRYERPAVLRSGCTAICTILTANGEFDVVDTYWSETDYTQALDESGFVIDEIAYPRAENDALWRSAEACVAPFIVIRSHNATT